MKKVIKLSIKKVTLRDLDVPKLEHVAGGVSHLPCATITCTCHTPCSEGDVQRD
jgi:hypothetical protein